MTLVDDRSRIGGRFNLVDVALVVVLFVLIPAAYGAYLLMRTPQPTLLSIKPSRLYQGNQLRVEIEGRDLRPFMRVSFNDVQGRTFLISSTRSAQVDLPELAAGEYDVVLYDFSQELARLHNALTIMPMAATPKLEMEVAGAFLSVPDALLESIKPGAQFPPTGDAEARVLTVGQAQPSQVRVRAGAATLSIPVERTRDLPATLRVACYISSLPDGGLGCIAHGPPQVPVAPNALLTLSGPRGYVNFQIQQVRSGLAPPVSQARVRFVVSPELAALMKAGDADSDPKAIGQQATILTLGASRPISAAEAGSAAPTGGPLRALDATLRVPVAASRGEWTYKDAPYKVGASFTFETPQYVAHGEIVGMTAPSAR